MASRSRSGGFKLRHIPASCEEADPGDADPDGWNLIGMLDHKGGIGNAARSNIEALKLLTKRHRTISFPSAKNHRPSDIPAIHGNNYLHFNPAGISIEELACQPWFSEGRNIGFWAWETTKTPAYWKAFDPFMSQIWVPSAFVQEALARSGFKTPVHVIPHAIAEQPQHLYPCDERPITFLVQFDGHSRFARKRPDLSMQAIISAALKTDEKIRIIIKCHHDDGSRLALPEYDGIEILKCDTWLDREKMEEIWKQVDVLVSLNRGEGFGLPLVEAMARGIAVVATNWSASIEYMDEENSFPVDSRGLEECSEAGDAYFKSGKWAVPNVSHATAQIIECMKLIKSGSIHAIAKKARETAASFSFNNMLDAMKTALSTP